MPKILITSGVHGYERTSVLSLYKFVKSCCENQQTLSDIIAYVQIKIIPVVCPWGYNNNSRVNENGVNINRNFASTAWRYGGEGTADFSGNAPGDQPETKIVQNWLVANPNAVFFIDWHNSSYINEISCLLGAMSEEAVKIKHDYLNGINKIIPYWQNNRDIQPPNIYGYTGGTGADTYGTSKSYAEDHGIDGFTLETSWNVTQHGIHSAFSIGTGAEAFSAILHGLKDFFKI